MEEREKGLVSSQQLLSQSERRIIRETVYAQTLILASEEFKFRPRLRFQDLGLGLDIQGIRENGPLCGMEQGQRVVHKVSSGGEVGKSGSLSSN